MQIRLLNTVLLAMLSTALWSPLASIGNVPGVPINLLSGVIVIGVYLMGEDLADYRREPKLKALVIGAFLAPLWLLLRRYALR